MSSEIIEEAPKKSNILVLTIKDKAVLYSAYMSFLKEEGDKEGGGIFIPTQKSFALGEEVQMLISLMDEPEKHPVVGIVVWITPQGAQGNRAPGIGVQFKGAEGKVVRKKIETLLASTQGSAKPTHTL
jgi:type IV pilus assembly protein PilZ